MSSETIDEQETPRLTPVVRAVLVGTAAALFLQFTVGNYPGFAGLFGFSSGALPDRWWTSITYPWVHAGAWHLAANMWALWLFGPRLERDWGSKRFGWLVALCALSAAAVQALFLRNGTLVGSSAAVFGVMTAYAMQWPSDDFTIAHVPMRVWTLALSLVAANLAIGVFDTSVAGSLNPAYLAHLGGIAAAWIYMRTPTGSMDQVRQRVAQLPEPGEPPRAIPRSAPRAKDRSDEVDEIVAKSKAIVAKRAPVLTPPTGLRRPDARPDDLNRVLDKISEHGLDSLTMDERRLLEEMSKRLRDK